MEGILPAAILTDLDDTILSFSEGALSCWERTCTEFAARIEGLTTEELLATILKSRAWFWADSKRHRRGRLKLDQARREIVAKAITQLSIDAPAFANEMVASYTLERENTIRLFPGAIGTLRCLRSQGVRLALVTNGESESQRRKIQRFELTPLFDCILIEEEFGVGKPDERIYLYALGRLNVKSEEAWMVGDNLEWDVYAPQKLGILGIWLDLLGQGLPEVSPIHPDRIIRSLTELV